MSDLDGKVMRAEDAVALAAAAGTAVFETVADGAAWDKLSAERHALKAQLEALRPWLRHWRGCAFWTCAEDCLIVGSACRNCTCGLNAVAPPVSQGGEA